MAAPASTPVDEQAKPSHEDLLASMTGGMSRDIAPHFAGSNRLRSDGRPKPEFRAELRQIADGRNALTAVVTLATPAAIVAGAVWLSHPVVWVLSFFAMAIAQNRMYILHHEASHRLLFSNRTINDRIGVNLFGWLPLGTGTHQYRRAHANHHRDEFGPKEPDFLLYSFYPVLFASARRKIARDAVGVSAYRILKPRITGIVKRRYFRNSSRFFSGQILVFTLFALAGQPWLYPLLWALPYVTFYQVINRLRSLAEHGGMTRSPDRRHTTHHVRQTLLARTIFVPYGVGYHLAHHVDSGVPFRNLKTLHLALKEDGYFPAEAEWPNYRTFWRSCILR